MTKSFHGCWGVIKLLIIAILLSVCDQRLFAEEVVNQSPYLARLRRRVHMKSNLGQDPNPARRIIVVLTKKISQFPKNPNKQASVSTPPVLSKNVG